MESKNEVFVTVIMPAYNVEKFIGEAIESILNQTHTNFELLISDDGSSDDTLQVIGNFNDPRIKLYTQENNLGYSGNMNFLFQRATGDYILDQDSDDISNSNRLEELLKVIISDTTLGYVGSHA